MLLLKKEKRIKENVKKLEIYHFKEVLYFSQTICVIKTYACVRAQPFMKLALIIFDKQALPCLFAAELDMGKLEHYYSRVNNFLLWHFQCFIILYNIYIGVIFK